MKTFQEGDQVQWNSFGQKVKGQVEKKLTEPTEIKNHHVAASPEHPEYLVRSDKTGKTAAHRAEALEKQEDEA